MKKIQRIILAFMLGVVPIQSVWADSKADTLFDAALNGDLEQVKTLIEKEGVDINAKESEIGATALMGASIAGHLEVVKALVEGKKGLLSMFSKGADINAKDNYGATALIGASMNGELEVVKYLINKGADINAKVKGDDDGTKMDGLTALMVASVDGHLEVVKYLINKGADINAVATMKVEGIVYNVTALDSAINNKRHKIIEVLKNAGAKSAKEIQK